MAKKKPTSSDEQLKPDPKYGSKLVSKFINCLMWKGKKNVAEQIFYAACGIVAEKVNPAGGGSDKTEGGTPLELFEKAVNNVKPLIEVRSKRIGGASYQVPMQVNPKRQQSLAIRWIIEAARAKTGKPMSERLASELIDAFNGRGGAMTTRENIHKMADANKAFAHFAW